MSGARYKLAEAEYFLTTIRQLPRGSGEFMYNVSAFLSACRGSFDVLLYDYATKYQLGFTLDDFIDDNAFERRAHTQNNHQALNFIVWWRNRLLQIQNDPVAGPLSTKRNVFIHRGRPPMTFTVYVSATLTVSSSVRTIRDGTVQTQADSNPSPPTSVSRGPTSPEPTQNVYFKDFPSRDVLSLCEEYFRIMTQTIEEAENQFP